MCTLYRVYNRLVAWCGTKTAFFYHIVLVPTIYVFMSVSLIVLFFSIWLFHSVCTDGLKESQTRTPAKYDDTSLPGYINLTSLSIKATSIELLDSHKFLEQSSVHRTIMQRKLLFLPIVLVSLAVNIDISRAESKESREAPFQRLPKDVVPTNYQVQVEPDLVNFTFTGSVSINVTVEKETADFVLNALELKIRSKAFNSMKRMNYSIFPCHPCMRYSNSDQVDARLHNVHSIPLFVCR